MKHPGPFDEAYFAALTLQTRRFGHTYVHTGAPRSFLTSGNENGSIHFTVSGFGRSLQSGGHKYKVHASKLGKPVSSHELRSMIPHN